MRTTLSWWAGTLALLWFSGCVQQPFGRLEGVLVDVEPEARPVRPGESGRVEITREGKEEEGRPSMALQKGDALITSTDGVAVMVLADAYQIIMDPGTDLTIENPSIFVRLGRIIVKKIKEIQEAFTVNTELGTAAVEGTEFVLEVNRRQQVQITVLDGRVKLYPRRGARWREPVSYVAGERGLLDSTRAIRMPLTRQTTDSLRRRLGHLSVTLRPEVPDVTGYPEPEAQAELKRHGLVPVIVPVITRQPTPVSGVARAAPSGREIPRVGTVVTTSPAPGTRIRQGARVRISVEQASVMIPNVMGQPLAVAQRMLASADLRLADTTSQVQPGATDGTVSGMAPSPGVYVRPGSAVALTIARAPTGEEVDGGSIRRRTVIRGADRLMLCSIPNLAGLTERQATDSLRSASMQVGPISRGSGDSVIDQNPKPGAARCGTIVSFTLGTPPDVIR